MKRTLDRFLKIQNYHYFIFIFFLVAINSNLYAQSFIEKIGGVKTDFVFSTDSVDLQIVEQAIIIRGFSDFNTSKNTQNSYGYAFGYGLQSYHLEFISTSEVKTIEKFKKKATNAYYDIKLYDENNMLIQNFIVLYRHSKEINKTVEISSYSINLNQIPIIIFNRVKRIDIVLILV